VGDKRRLLTNTFANGAAQVAILVVSFAFMPLLANHFGLSGYGMYMLAFTLGGYAYLLDLGVGTALQKRIAEHDAKGDAPEVGRLVSTGLAFYAAVGCVAALGILVIALLAPRVFNVSPGDALLLRRLLYVSAAQSFVLWPLSTAIHVLAGFQRFKKLAATSLASTGAQVVAMTLVLLAHKGPLMMFASLASITTAAGCLNLLLARRELKGVHVNISGAAKGTLLSVLRFSWPIFVGQLSAFIVYQQTDRVVLAAFVGASAVGLYEAAGKFQGFIVQMVGLANSAVMPMASSLDAREQHESIRTLFVRGTKYTLACSLPVTLVLIVFARPLILSWLGPAFASAPLAAQIIVLPQLFVAGLSVGGNIVIGRGFYHKRIPYILGAALLNLALSLILVRGLGILGVVLGTAIPYLLDFPFGLHWILKYTQVSFRIWLRKVVLPTYPLLVVPLALGLVLLRTPLMNGLLGVAAAAAACTAAYLVAFFVLGLDRTERNDVRTVGLFLLRRALALVGRAEP
jgi:O-antigen/teichoic acid export membrane protein